MERHLCSAYEIAPIITRDTANSGWLIVTLGSPRWPLAEMLIRRNSHKIRKHLLSPGGSRCAVAFDLRVPGRTRTRTQGCQSDQFGLSTAHQRQCSGSVGIEEDHLPISGPSVISSALCVHGLLNY